MQIKNGTVTATNASATITSSAGADWSEVVSGCIFVVVGRTGIYYTNASAVFDVPSGTWSVSLLTPYNEATISAATYIIAKDFTAFYNLPLISTGDVQTAVLVSRALQLIDANMRTISTTITAGANTVYNKTSHGFAIGTAVYVDGSGVFQEASSDTLLHSQVIGIVSSVNTPLSGDFTLNQGGLLTGFAVTLTPGSVYLLKSTASAANFSSNPADTTLSVPLFIAQGTHEAVVFGFVSAQNSPMVGATVSVDGQAGVVPQPLIAQRGKYLRGDGTWASAVPDDTSILLGKLATTPAFSTANWGALTGSMSIYNMLLDLNNRTGTLETIQFTNITTFKYSGIWICPSGVTSIRVKALGAGGGAAATYSGTTLTDTCGGGSGSYIESTLAVTAGATYLVSVGAAGSLTHTSGFLITSVAGGNTTLTLVGGSTLITAKGGSVGTVGGSGLAGTGSTAPTGTLTVTKDGSNGLKENVSSVNYAIGGNSYVGGAGAHSRLAQLLWIPGPTISSVASVISTGPGGGGGALTTTPSGGIVVLAGSGQLTLEW